jgi:menaquinone-dependent protoporphyrinogen IX oxidase
MTGLVSAASKHGAMREIAEAIARVLDEQGVSAEFVDLNDPL